MKSRINNRYPKRLYRRSLLGSGVIAVLIWAFAAIHLFTTTIPTVTNKQILDSSQFVNKLSQSHESYSLNQNYQNPKILSHGCSVTILLTEPRISKAHAGSDVWYSLESMAVNVGMYSKIKLVTTFANLLHLHIVSNEQFLQTTHV